MTPLSAALGVIALAVRPTDRQTARRRVTRVETRSPNTHGPAEYEPRVVPPHSIPFRF